MGKEILGHCLQLTKDKHGHQTVQRMLQYGSGEVRAEVAKELRGHVSRLMTHNLGALVVETGFTKAWSPAQCWELYQELYGNEFVHFKVEPVRGTANQQSGKPSGPPPQKNLASILEAAPEKRSQILDHMLFALTRQIEKRLLGLSVVQRLLLEFLQNANPEGIVAMVGMVKEHIISLVGHKDGAAAAVLCFGYASAKERKVLLRGLKGSLLDTACHPYGHMVVCAALECVDDTKETGKAVLGELIPHLGYLACNRCVCVLWLWSLCTPRVYVYTQTRICLHTNTHTCTSPHLTHSTLCSTL